MRQISRRKWISGFMSGIVLTAALLGGGAAASAADNWFDRYKAWDNRHGGEFYSRVDSADLGWQENYVLRSYMNMYEVTKDTGWLDKLVTHADTIMDKASDPDGDGYSGWDSNRFSPGLLANGSFATAASGDATLPASWTRSQATTTTGYRTSLPCYYDTLGTDTWGAVIKSDGTQWVQMYQTLTAYTPNKSYTLRFTARTNGSPAKGRAYVYNVNTSSIVGAPVVVDNTSWQTYSYTFTAPATAGQTLRLYLGNNSYTYKGGIAMFDNVSISAAYPYLSHEGNLLTPIAQFIRLVAQNPSLQSQYSTKAGSYRTMIEDEIVPQWESSSFIGNTWVNDPAAPTTQGYYKEPANFDSLTGAVYNPLPFNMFLSFSELLLTMYDVNANPAYLDKALKMNKYFESKLVVNGTGCKWYGTGTSGVLEKVTTGNLDIYTAVDSWNHGLAYSSTWMERLTKTLTDYMWNGSLTAPTLHNYVDGTMGSQTSDYLWSKEMYGWLQLAQFDSRVWKMAAEQYRNYTPTTASEALTLSEIMKWNPVKVINPGFELKASTDATLPARWTRLSGSNSTTAYLDVVNRKSGEYGVTVSSDLTAWRGLYQEWTEWEPNATYELTFDANTDGGAAGGRLFLQDVATSAILGSIVDFTNTSWETKTLTFTAPSSSSATIRLYLENKSYSVAGKAHFDNVRIKKLGEPW